MNLIVTEKRRLAHQVFELSFRFDEAHDFTPGQFLHVRTHDASHVLRRPISIAKWDSHHLTGSMVIRDQGEGTHDILNTKQGQSLDALGPLGKGFPIDFLGNQSQALLIGGGVGVPALLECAKALHAKNIQVIVALGFQSQDNVFYVEEFKRYGEVRLATLDGSVGSQGTVETLLSDLKPDAIYACGPIGLAKFVQTHYKHHPHVYLSLEERMACGVGACAGCTVSKSTHGNFKVCSDGPVFNAQEVSL